MEFWNRKSKHLSILKMAKRVLLPRSRSQRKNSQLISQGKNKAHAILRCSRCILHSSKIDSIKTTQAAFRIAGIDFEVVRGSIVAKIDFRSFITKIKKLTADNTMTSGPRPAHKCKSTKKPLRVINADCLKKK
ncbi:MAG: hypothetical protein EZS28_021580 [Streblomastix strix]|uniref:Uncharacterized protein n=1 Tax=Streblomastix strix TaxID=222440 RepID=A0A5J4VK99_9EUKA|nr:MAG: hypothetical protein EZS28_021580 [Streblomastix strix]